MRVPLAGAISAGCIAILKPSEVSPAVAELLAKLIPLYLDTTCYKVVLGAVPETTKLLEINLFIFYRYFAIKMMYSTHCNV